VNQVISRFGVPVYTSREKFRVSNVLRINLIVMDQELLLQSNGR